MAETNTLYNKLLVPQLVSRGLGRPYSLSLDSTALAPLPAQDRMYSKFQLPCVSLFYVIDIGSTGSRGRTVGIPCAYPSP